MARKQYQKLTDVWDAQIHKREKEQVEIILKGRNTKGTEVSISAFMPDWIIKYLNRDIVGVAKNKYKEAADFLNEIRNQSN